MTTKNVSLLAQKLFLQYDLKGWNFTFDRSKTRFGMCNYSKKTISLSRYFVEINTDAEILDTLLHEIAHALCGKKAGHGKIWKEKIIEMGGKPDRCFSSTTVNTPKMKYTITCPSCKNSHQRNIKKRNLACKKCCENSFFGRFTEKFLFEWEVN